MLVMSPCDHSLGPRTGGQASLLEVPPNAIVGSGDSEFKISMRNLRSIPCMTVSLFCVTIGVDGETGRLL